MAFSLISGWFSAIFWRSELPFEPFKQPWMCIQAEGDMTPSEGRIVFAGSEAILFYHHQSKMTRYLKRDQIKMLLEPRSHIGEFFRKFFGVPLRWLFQNSENPAQSKYSAGCGAPVAD
jgi:hypothetical protein